MMAYAATHAEPWTFRPLWPGKAVRRPQQPRV